MSSNDAKLIRNDLMLLRAWIELWRDDTKSKLLITESSIGHALSVIDRASVSLARIEAQQREAA